MTREGVCSIARCGGFCRRLAAVLALVALAATARLGMAQPVNDAALDCAPGNGVITDADFASIMAGALIKSGKANVADSVFLFQQCYGGGMIDNLSSAFGTVVPWVAGSASAPNQLAIGQLSPAEAVGGNFFPTESTVPMTAASPGSFWTNALTPQISATSNVLDSINTANTDDPVATGKNASYQLNGTTYNIAETPQSSSGNGGNKSVFTDPAASTFRAILWAGNPDSARHPNNITAMYNALSTAWSKVNSNIMILYGSFGAGTAPGGVTWKSNGAATRTNLVNAVGSLGITSSTEFLFYATDHGTPSKAVAGNKGAVGADGSDVENYSLDPSLVQGIAEESDWVAQEDSAPGFNPYEPYIEVDYDSVAADNTVAVYAGSDLLGYLPASAGSDAMDFNIPYDDVNVSGDSITLDNLGSTAFDLDGETFWGGESNDDPGPLPEPGSVSLACAAAVSALARRTRRL